MTGLNIFFFRVLQCDEAMVMLSAYVGTPTACFKDADVGVLISALVLRCGCAVGRWRPSRAPV